MNDDIKKMTDNLGIWEIENQATYFDANRGCMKNFLQPGKINFFVDETLNGSVFKITICQ